MISHSEVSWVWNIYFIGMFSLYINNCFKKLPFWSNQRCQSYLKLWKKCNQRHCRQEPQIEVVKKITRAAIAPFRQSEISETCKGFFDLLGLNIIILLICIGQLSIYRIFSWIYIYIFMCLLLYQKF